MLHHLSKNACAMSVASDDFSGTATTYFVKTSQMTNRYVYGTLENLIGPHMSNVTRSFRKPAPYNVIGHFGFKLWCFFL